MDDFAAHTDRRFDAVDKRFDAVDKRLDRLERRVDSGFDQVNGRIDNLHQTIHRTMLLLGVGMMTTLALGLIGVIVTH
jgi:tetrahydromethanopterin S-methyltransferase subunit G